MSDKSVPDLSLFIDILFTLERIGIPYVIIGGFAASLYGITRATYDIDIIVDLTNDRIQALADAYPSPRYYADPYQMKNAIHIKSFFNIIDSERGEKADLFPLSMDERYQPAFDNRIRQTVEIFNYKPFEVWAALPEDVIIGKLMAWTELKTKRHESDIYEMLVVAYLDGNGVLPSHFDENRVDIFALSLGAETNGFWRETKKAAQSEASRISNTSTN